MNYKQMEKQVAMLKQSVSPPRRRGVVCAQLLEEAEHDALAPNERIVEDYYEDTDGEKVVIAERITTDPSDNGRDFAHGTWDRASFEAFRRKPVRIRRVIWETDREATRITTTSTVGARKTF